MSNTLCVSEMEKSKADIILQHADTKILLAAAVKVMSHFNVSMAEATRLLGLSKTTAWRHWGATFFNESPNALQKNGHGGRRRQYLSIEDEKTFLAEWHQKAQDGQIVTIAEMRDAFEKKSGKPITDVGFYKLLWRHRWRKLKPDTKHPKTDFEAQEDFKKKSVSGSGPRGQVPCKAKWAWFPGNVSR